MDPPQPPPKSRIARTLRFVGESFGPLVVFYACEHLFGLLAAIISGIVFGVALVVLQLARDKKVSPFTAFIATSVVAFGALDLHYQTGFFVKLEPALGNAATGVFFLGSVVLGRPVIIELAERAAGRKLDHARRYLVGWTIAWGLFFFLRTGIYVWMAYNVTLDRALAVRAILGPLSFGAMFALEIPLRKILFRKRVPEPAPALASPGIEPPPPSSP